QIFFLQKIRVALYPVATFLYGLAILYRFRRGEYWSATWPVPFLLTVGVLPLAVHVLSMREQGAAWWVEGGEREGEGERAGAEGEGGGGGGGGQPGVARGWGGKGKVPSRRSAVVLLLGVAIGVFGKWVEIAGFE
ncbi:hypothetical protein KC365_g19069, partial [Hortaea werneckii]